MGFFPFLAPFSPWITQVMKDREANKQASILQKNPFAILTSAALVVKAGSDVFDSDVKTRAQAVKGLIASGFGEYKGCIIANNTNNVNLSYSINETIVVIDQLI
jgi:hypothetical protein